MPFLRENWKEGPGRWWGRKVIWWRWFHYSTILPHWRMRKFLQWWWKFLLFKPTILPTHPIVCCCSTNYTILLIVVIVDYTLLLEGRTPIVCQVLFFWLLPNLYPIVAVVIVGEGWCSTTLPTLLFSDDWLIPCNCWWWKIWRRWFYPVTLLFPTYFTLITVPRCSACPIPCLPAACSCCSPSCCCYLITYICSYLQLICWVLQFALPSPVEFITCSPPPLPCAGWKLQGPLPPVMYVPAAVRWLPRCWRPLPHLCSTYPLFFYLPVVDLSIQEDTFCCSVPLPCCWVDCYIRWWFGKWPTLLLLLLLLIDYIYSGRYCLMLMIQLLLLCALLPIPTPCPCWWEEGRKEKIPHPSWWWPILFYLTLFLVIHCYYLHCSFCYYITIQWPPLGLVSVTSLMIWYWLPDLTIWLCPFYACAFTFCFFAIPTCNLFDYYLLYAYLEFPIVPLFTSPAILTMILCLRSIYCCYHSSTCSCFSTCLAFSLLLFTYHLLVRPVYSFTLPFCSVLPTYLPTDRYPFTCIPPRHSATPTRNYIVIPCSLHLPDSCGKVVVAFSFYCSRRRSIITTYLEHYLVCDFDCYFIYAYLPCHLPTTCHIADAVPHSLLLMMIKLYHSIIRCILPTIYYYYLLRCSPFLLEYHSSDLSWVDMPASVHLLFWRPAYLFATWSDTHTHTFAVCLLYSYWFFPVQTLFIPTYTYLCCCLLPTNPHCICSSSSHLYSGGDTPRWLYWLEGTYVVIHTHTYLCLMPTCLLLGGGRLLFDFTTCVPTYPLPLLYFISPLHSIFGPFLEEGEFSCTFACYSCCSVGMSTTVITITFPTTCLPVIVLTTTSSLIRCPLCHCIRCSDEW